jgi:predicted nuclease of predicted toxin-antitoxin system
MKFKIDENIDHRIVELLIKSGYEATTVVEQNLKGCSDKTLIEICKKKNLCLITLDTGFSNVLLYPPENYSGIIVIRVKKTLIPDILELVRQIIPKIKQLPLEKQLWIVEPGRIRIHESKR